MRFPSTSHFLLISENNRDRILEILKASIQRKRISLLNKILSRLHPTDLANLWNFFIIDEKKYLLSLLSVEIGAKLLSELETHERDEIFKEKNIEWIMQYLEVLETDDVVDILKELPTRKANFIIRKFDLEYSAKIKTLIQYPEETAGSLMSSNLFAVNEDARIGDLINKFRELDKKEKIKDLQFIYVVDQNDRLLGYISLRKLILEESSMKANEVMKPPPILITPFMDQEEVAQIFKNHNLISLPVVDDKDILLGKITIDDIVDVLEEEASEDVFKMVGLNIEKSMRSSILNSLKNRLPWMFINLAATGLSALLIRYFQPTLEKYIILAIFMPMIAALGGATGNQIVTMIVRGLTLGEIHLKQARFFLIRELGSIFIGSILLAGTMMLFTYYIYQESSMTFIIVVSSALIFNMLSATVLGTGIPLLLKLFGFDPAAGSSILVTTLTDLTGFYIFLGFATIFLVN